jgi:hypothetical protein
VAVVKTVTCGSGGEPIKPLDSRLNVSSRSKARSSPSGVGWTYFSDAMSSHLLNREDVRTTFTKPCEHCMSERKYHEVVRQIQLPS